MIPDEPAGNSKGGWKPYSELSLTNSNTFQYSLYSKYTASRWQKRESALQDDMITFAFICPCMSWSGSGLYCQLLLRVVLGFLLCLFLAGQLHPTVGPPTFPQLCAHGSHSEEGEDITKKHLFFFLVMWKTVATVCTNQIHNKKDAVPWALPFKVLLLVLFHSPVNRGKPLVSAIQIVWIFIHKLLMLLNDVHDTLLLKEGAGNFLLLPFSLLFVFSDKTDEIPSLII